MSTGTIIKALREAGLMTQADLASKLHVTRQAVSRWENDETTPGSDLLLSMSEIFGVSVDRLLESKKLRYCECCGMPIEPSIMGLDQHGNLDPRYCKWCLEDGKFAYTDVDTMLDFLVANVPHPDLDDSTAREYFRQELARLPYWQPKMGRSRK